MDKGICNGDYLPANQGAPYSTELAASDETWRSGMGAQRGDWKNSSHHDKSKWKYLLSLIGWFSLQKAESRLIIRWRKVQPEGTTLHACWRLPIKDSSSFCVQWRFCDQKTRIVWIRSNFSCERCACNRRESSSMPKTVRIVEGLSNLSGWRGIPQSWNCWILVSMFRWHVWELGGPRVWKSSRLWRRNLTSYCFLRTHSTRSATEEKT